MINLCLSSLLVFGVKHNVALNGAGVLIYQKEKQYTKFRLLSAMFLSLGTMLCLLISYFLDKYVYISVLISVLFVGIYNLIVSKAFSKMSHYTNYLYEKSSSFIVDFVYTLSLIFAINFSLYEVSEFLMMMISIGIVLFVCNVIFGIFLLFICKILYY